MRKEFIMFRNLCDYQKALVFIILTLGLGLIFILLHNPVLITLYMFIPTISALLLMLVVTRDGYSARGWARLGLHKMGFRGLFAALMLPVLVLGIGYALVWMMRPESYQALPKGVKAGGIALSFILITGFNTISFSLGEELGWRGYLHSALIRGGRLKTYLITGLVWAVWHYPLIFLTDSYNADGNRLWTTLMFTMTLISLSVILGEMRFRVGSVWPAALFHSSHNVTWGILGGMSVTSFPAVIYLAGESGLFPWLLYSLAAGILYRRKQTRSQSGNPSKLSEAEETGSA